MSGTLRVAVAAVVLLVAHAGCDSAVEVDVKCEKLCLAAPGPTLPGIPALVTVVDGGVAGIDGGVTALDGGVPGQLGGPLPRSVLPTVEWVADLSFNEVLKHLPSAAANLSADVRLGSISLTSTSRLDFIESLEVTLSHGAATSPANGAGNSAGAPGCRTAGTAIRVAYFQRGEGAATGSSLELVLVDPALNLFDCMKDEPSRFRVTLNPRAGSMNLGDVPLALRTCVGAETHVSYP
jgi:hypothetical protein